MSKPPGVRIPLSAIDRRTVAMFKTIDGSQLVCRYTVLREGWEFDEQGWVTEDGRVWGTSHGQVVELSLDEFEEEMATVAASLKSMKAARKRIDELTDGKPPGRNLERSTSRQYRKVETTRLGDPDQGTSSGREPAPNPR